MSSHPHNRARLLSQILGALLPVIYAETAWMFTTCRPKYIHRARDKVGYHSPVIPSIALVAFSSGA
jgi:hypothetical protein